jgi:hypothetical protein
MLNKDLDRIPRTWIVSHEREANTIDSIPTVTLKKKNCRIGAYFPYFKTILVIAFHIVQLTLSINIHTSIYIVSVIVASKSSESIYIESELTFHTVDNIS